jgi:cytochrome c-type biogenesis protein CcsB
MPVDATLATLSDRLLVAAILVYSAAMLVYAAEYSFGRRSRVGLAAAPAAPAGAAALVGAGAALAAAPVSPAVGGGTGPAVTTGPAGTGSTGRPVEGRSGTAVAGAAAAVLTVVGLLLHAGVLVTRAAAAHRVPWGNMYEFAISVCFIAVLAWLVVMARQARGERRASIRHLGAFVMLPVVLLLGLAGTVLYTPVVPLVPALNSYWLWIHVSAAVIASGVFLVSFVTATLYLIREKYDRVTAAGGTLRFPATLGARFPAADGLERTTFRVIAFAFPVWTFATIAGAIWAEAAWSRYWGWDPKETWAFIAWVIYAAYLHARATAGWRGRRAAWIAVLGWAAMMINLFGVNLVITGLHSYAGLQ